VLSVTSLLPLSAADGREVAPRDAEDRSGKTVPDNGRLHAICVAAAMRVTVSPPAGLLVSERISAK
jgi:hypothetical protein